MLDPPAAGGPAPPATTAWRHMVPANGTNGTVVGQAGEQPGSRAGPEAPSQGVGPEEGPAGGSKAGGKAGGKAAAYERALHKKLSMTTELRHRFRQAGLSKEREAELNNTIQSYFKGAVSFDAKSWSLLRSVVKGVMGVAAVGLMGILQPLLSRTLGLDLQRWALTGHQALAL
ncbi:C-CAP/cofactor C-like domain-containing protein, partial [Haematococcus lacustris]